MKKRTILLLGILLEFLTTSLFADTDTTRIKQFVNTVDTVKTIQKDTFVLNQTNMYKVPISVLAECVANLELLKDNLEHSMTSTISESSAFVLERRLKRVKKNIKLLKDNYQV